MSICYDLCLCNFQTRRHRHSPASLVRCDVLMAFNARKIQTFVLGSVIEPDQVIRP